MRAALSDVASVINDLAQCTIAACNMVSMRHRVYFLWDTQEVKKQSARPGIPQLTGWGLEGSHPALAFFL